MKTEKMDKDFKEGWQFRHPPCFFRGAVRWNKFHGTGKNIYIMEYANEKFHGTGKSICIMEAADEKFHGIGKNIYIMEPANENPP